MTAKPFLNSAPCKKKIRVHKILSLLILLFTFETASQTSGGIPPLNSHRRSTEIIDEPQPDNRIQENIVYRRAKFNPVFLKLDPFYINLPPIGSNNKLEVELYLRVANISVEVELKKFLPIVQDRIITVLSSQSYEVVAPYDGKAIAGKEIALAVNSIIDPQLTAIYILQQKPTNSDLANLERIGVMPKGMALTIQKSQLIHEAMTILPRLKETDLLVLGVFFKTFILK